jgi:ABC-type dipeptide/oligopeptide/nickel transport system permease subunit
MSEATNLHESSPVQTVFTRKPVSSRRISRLRRFPRLVGGGSLVLILILAAVFADWITPYEPNDSVLMDNFEPPSAEHWFGTDHLGRDIFSRIVHGARISLAVGILATGLGILIGVPAGLLSGYLGGWTEGTIMRVTDSLISFPGLILALAISFALGPTVVNVVIALAVVRMPLFARLIRGETLSVREKDYVLAAKAMGATSHRIMIRHILPILSTIIITQAAISIGLAIFTEASLSFLGMGVPPPTPSWGRMLREGYTYLEIAPWVSMIPGLVLFVAVLGFNFLSDGLRDFLDPTLAKSGKRS